ncbi:MAG TPA: acetate--CoA ligase family protein [Candidatus Moranbacteria bacterium]|nr:acetate--CoA ligase family protein [Candidatus Moranbacteria bacterium]
MKKNNLDLLFDPQSIAIVGASNKKGKIGTIIAENISKLGYGGKTYLINPSYKFLGFKRCFPSLSAVKKEIDLAIICVPAKFVFDVVKDGAKNVKNFVIISAGFSEIGKEGAKREQKLLDFAKKNKLNILGPNCLGFINPTIDLNASFAAGMPKKGNVAFVSQSGALIVALLDKAKEENLGFSKVISIGNQMQVDEAELLEYLSENEETKVIGMYLEGIRDGQKFLRIARKVSHKKPIVILKAGKTEKAQEAISSHTGALAGSDLVTDAAFKDAGIVRADTLEDFFDLLRIMSFSEAPKNNQVSVITNAGGAGVLATDAFKDKDIALAEFDEKTKKIFAKHLPAEASVHNPIDLLGDADSDRYQNILLDLKKGKPGSVVCILTPQQQTPVDEIAKIIALAKEKNKMPVNAVFIGGERVKSGIAHLKRKNVPTFESPEDCILALDKYYQWDAFRKEKQEAEKYAIDAERRKKVSTIIQNARREKRAALCFSEAAEVMREYGIDSGKFWIVSENGEKPGENDFPLAVKIDSDKVLHKSDKQGVILNIKNQAELEEAIKKLNQNFPGEKILLQPMQQNKTEIILGIKKDPIFGPIVVYGLGGIYTEIFHLVDFLVPPLSPDSIKKQILSGKIKFLFEGARGQAAYDAGEFAKIIKGIMDFAAENNEIQGFDINPLFIYNDGRKASAVDIKIII